MELTTNRKQGRIAYIDFLKFIGLSCIILAHVRPASWIMMIRSFDVPLMVILSAILARSSYNKYASKNFSNGKYYVSRFKRLVFPTWLFLTIYFGLYLLLSGRPFSFSYYIYSYGLTQYGIGYVWIILIYLYCALLIPLFYRLGFSAKSIIFVSLVYVLYEIAFHFGIGTQNKIIMSTFYYVIPYGAITFLGYNYSIMSKRAKHLILSVSFMLFLCLATHYWISLGSPQLVKIAKYPPRLYYLGYGVFCTFGLLLICEKSTSRFFNNIIISYISQHSMWIYLWHVLTLTVYEVFGLPEFWPVKYITVYMLAVIAALVADKLVNLIEGKCKMPLLKYLH